MRFGPLEIIIIIAIVLIITGAAFAPSLGRNLGKGVKQLRQAVGGDDKKTKVIKTLSDDATAVEVKRRVAEQKGSAKSG
ncbi:twin-arginine translocase TatA/TatE family subunit [Dehalogenimonas sp. 4OHTPN]|uniref:Twin-arginine translocase TatA/TatE family subunit n=1 Tax=Dehalogenimonas sp. 4OHTPN TaxID=3166643 RepID=A0AAU8GA48_9CHLR